MSDVTFEIKGIDKLIANLAAMRSKIKLYMRAAGREAANEVLDEQGLRNYPAETAANKPPTPYYIRGVGTQYAKKNKGNSERYGTQFYVQASGYNTKIGNRASYARWLTDENDQASHMAAIGWKKLKDVADSKVNEIKRIYQAWVDKLIKDNDL